VDEQGYVQGTLMIVAGACVCMCVCVCVCVCVYVCVCVCVSPIDNDDTFYSDEHQTNSHTLESTRDSYQWMSSLLRHALTHLYTLTLTVQSNAETVLFDMK
jgi:hypothetical protein